jgi:tRNA-2-methylthio-N6-dimethylallyladenosine synthase
VRGRESSRHPDNIIKEIKTFVDSGVKEITLLGQNVNSYGKKEGLLSFTELLARVQRIEGLLRIRFTTSHPKDFDQELINAFQSNDKLCNHIHLPVQSGSSRVLRAMRRGYSRERYLDLIHTIQGCSRPIAISTDIIVGFPGESQADFEQTLQLIETVEFDGLFAFQYSDRPQAPSVRLPDKLPEPIIRKRLQIVLELQDKFTRRKNEALVGSTPLVLTDGLSKKQISDRPVENGRDLQWTGRTSTNKIVNFYVDEPVAGCENLTGKMVSVRIDKGFSHSLLGRVINVEPSAGGLKGVENYAA